MSRYAVVLVALAGSLLSSGLEAAPEWSVQRVSGEVSIMHYDEDTVPEMTIELIKPGDRVRTGENGRVMLVRGAETIVVSPNSDLFIARSVNERTTVHQASGEAAYQVEKKNVQHFEVTTPFIAAVVKGTVFTVGVGDKSAQVAVASGVVEVRDTDTGQTGTIYQGQQASAANGLGLVLAQIDQTEQTRRYVPAKTDALADDDADEAATSNEFWEYSTLALAAILFFVFIYDLGARSLRHRYRRRLRRQS